MEPQLINRVANSGLITINLEDFYPKQEFIIFDLKDFLFQALILKEKDFRLALKDLDWTGYQDKIVLIQCSADAVIPLWAYMLVAQYLTGIASDVFVGNVDEYLKAHYKQVLEQNNWTEMIDQRIVVKGCSDKAVPEDAYALLTKILKPIAKSIMFGEPCSTVPVYKKS